MKNLTIKQDRGMSIECQQLLGKRDSAQSQAQQARDHAQDLLEKIEFEEGQLERLREQRQRTGDDGFDLDIEQQKDKIQNLRDKVERARNRAREWESEARIIELQIIANDCGNFA